MKKLSIKLLMLGIVLMSAISCNQNELEPNDTDEFKFIRLIISDEKNSQISLVNPREGSVETFNARFAKAAVYTTESGRYAGLVHRENNMVETFDTGFEAHGDHVDVKGTPKFGTLIGESSLPTHFKSKKGEIMTFNDGDGSLSVGKENDIHKSGYKLNQIQTGNVAHHGAMATFSNGSYAITEKDGSISGTLPERVKIIDNNGKLLFTSKMSTKGIHGNATDGNYAVFGSASGVLIVESDGQQRLINYPNDFGSAWFGTILETAVKGKFIGYTAAKGVFMIDVPTNKIISIFESTDIMQCKVDFSGTKVVVLLHNGFVKVFDLKTNQLKNEAFVTTLVDKAETQKPTIEATQKYLYLILPKIGELHKIELNNLSNIKKIKVSATPYRIAILGAELNNKGSD